MPTTRQGFFRNAALFLFVAVALTVIAAMPLNAQTVTEYRAETRFQLDFHVPDAALAALLPAGFTSNAATQGAAKDANIRVIFIDSQTINGPDGKPLGAGSNRLAYLVAPVKDSTGATAQLVIAGLTDDSSDAPGPFGVYQLATTHKMERSISSDSGPVAESQDWVFTAATGEHLELHVKFERGMGNKGNGTDVKFYSAKNPTFYQISHQEQVVDIARNATTNPPDHVKEYSFKASGGVYGKLFDGTEKALSWDDVIWINRTVSLP